MIPDFYYENPFPINLVSDDIMDFFIHRNKEYETQVLLALLEQDVTSFSQCFNKALDFYMKNNFAKGIFALINEGHEFIKQAEKDNLTKEILNELKIDISHLKGMSLEEANFVVIPFENMDHLEYFSYILRKKNLINYYVNGEHQGENFFGKKT